MTHKMKFDRIGNEVHYTIGKDKYCFQETYNRRGFKLLACSRDREPSHEVFMPCLFSDVQPIPKDIVNKFAIKFNDWLTNAKIKEGAQTHEVL